MVTQTQEDYLRAIYVLEEKKGEIRSVNIASYLCVSKPSVSEMVNYLCDDGLIQAKKYGPIILTQKGKNIAKKLTSKHRLIELFLKNILKIHDKKIHEEAHRLEHAFSDESILKIKKLLNNPKRDPHGQPIP